MSFINTKGYEELGKTLRGVGRRPYRCPFCLRRFDSPGAVAAHALACRGPRRKHVRPLNPPPMQEKRQ